MSPLRALALHVLLILGMVGFDLARSAGEPARHSEALPDLLLGPMSRDHDLSHSEYRLETGKAYRLKVSAGGGEQYAFQAPGFAGSIFLRRAEAGGVGSKPVTLAELAFEAAGEAEIFFVPTRPGRHRFYARGPEGETLQGAFLVR